MVDSETIEYLFWECKPIQTLWDQLTTFLEKQQLKGKLPLLNCSGNVNTLNIPEFNNTVNNITILMKYFIFSCMNCFINHFKQRKIQIKKIALNDKLQIFEQKMETHNTFII